VIEQWQELKETITEMRDNGGTGTQQEVCRFLVNYMDLLEVHKQEPILDKIRTEIIDKYMTATGEVNTVAKGCLQIIDKYKAEMESKE